MTETNKQELRAELSNHAIGSNAHLRKLALALLDELEAKDKRIANPDQWTRDIEETLLAATDRNTELERRIAELENDEVRQRLANAEHQLHMAELAKHNLRANRKAQFRKRKVAELRVAELEARTLTVKLPQGYVIRPGHPINDSKRGVMIPKDGGEWLSRIDVEIAIRAAGIALDTGE